MDQFKYDIKDYALDDLKSFSNMHMHYEHVLYLVKTNNYWMIMSKHVPESSDVVAVAYRGVVYTRYM